jgi:hypothetical protein
MEPASARPRYEAIDHDDLLVHEWRVTQLTHDRSARTSRWVHPQSRRKQRTKDGHRLLQSHPVPSTH